MIHCLVIDDEPLARKLLEDFIRKTSDLTCVASFPSALKARELLTKKKIDLMFLDIQMPDINGLDFLRTLPQRPQVIVTTAHAEFALEGFELDVVDYLLKPFDFNRFLKAINKVVSKAAPQTSNTSLPSNDFIFVKDGSKMVKIILADVLYIKGAREYVTIVTREKKVTTLQSMKNLETDLPPTFIRSHNSYIINLLRVKEVHASDVLVENELLPIGTSYKKVFFERIKNRLKT